MAFTLNKLSETSTKIKLGWEPPANVYGYGFFSKGIWRSNGSRIFESGPDKGKPRNWVEFAKGDDPYEVTAHIYNGIGQVAIERAAYSSSPPPPPPPPPDDWQAPLIITQGGIYEGGAYESTSTSQYTGAVEIRTTAPVTIRNMKVRNLTRGDGSLIWATNGADVTIENVTGYGHPRWECGRFFNTWITKNLTIRNCTINYTRGIKCGSGQDISTGVIRILNNRHNNIAGGYFGRIGQVGNFFQITVCDVASVEVAWNEIINEPCNVHPDASRDDWWMHEDVFSIYHTSDVHMHDNMIWHSSFPGNLDGSSEPNGQWSHQGGITGDASVAGPGVHRCVIEDNHLIDGYGVFFSVQYSGDYNIIRRNRVIADGFLGGLPSVTDPGPRIENGWAGLGISSGGGTHNQVYDNVVGYVNREGNRNDWAGVTTGAGNISLPPPVTRQTELSEWTLWQQKIAANGITIGAT